jgi:hypothetical protein
LGPDFVCWAGPVSTYRHMTRLMAVREM